jgi:hypothetical protein
MAHQKLSCPRCRRWLTYLPFKGLTLHYRCDEHGLLTFKPLVLVNSADRLDLSDDHEVRSLNSTHDAA